MIRDGFAYESCHFLGPVHAVVGEKVIGLLFVGDIRIDLVRHGIPFFFGDFPAEAAAIGLKSIVIDIPGAKRIFFTARRPARGSSGVT